MFCTNCGNKISDEAKFCPSCGARTDEPDTPATQPVMQPVTQPAQQPVTQPAQQPVNNAWNPQQPAGYVPQAPQSPQAQYHPMNNAQPVQPQASIPQQSAGFAAQTAQRSMSSSNQASQLPENYTPHAPQQPVNNARMPQRPVNNAPQTPPAPQVPQTPPAVNTAPKENPMAKVGNFFSDASGKAVDLFKSKSPKKWIILGSAAAVVVIAVLLIIFIPMLNKKSGPNDVIYLKDMELFRIDADARKPGGEQFTERLVTDEKISEYNEYAEGYEEYEYSLVDDIKITFASGYYYYDEYRLVTVTSDGRIIYPDRIGAEEDGGYSLYYKNINKLDEDGVKIASDVFLYEVTENGEMIYLTYTDASLYIHDFENKRLVARDVGFYKISENGESIYYGTCTGDDEGYYYDGLYFASNKDGQLESKLISENIDDVCISEDLSYVIYYSDDDVYFYTVEEGSKLVAEDIEDFYVTESGEAVYTVKDDVIRIEDYIADSCRSDDDTYASMWIEEPDIYDYWLYIDDYEEAYEAYVDAYYEYYELLELQWAAEERNELREEIENGEWDIPLYSMYYCAGEKPVLISEDVSSLHLIDGDVVIFSECSQGINLYLYLDEYDDYYSFTDRYYDEVYDAVYKSSCIAYKGNTFEVNDYDVSGAVASEDGKTIYLIVFNEEEYERYEAISSGSDVPEGDYSMWEEPYNELYKITVSGGKASQPELIDTGILMISDDISMSVHIFGDNLVYFKSLNYDHYIGDMYINGQFIAENVPFYSIKSNPAAGGFITYMEDFRVSSESGTLMRWENGETEQISDDAHCDFSADYFIRDDGSIVYLYDYNPSSDCGDLYIWKDSEKTLLDSEVSLIVTYNYV